MQGRRLVAHRDLTGAVDAGTRKMAAARLAGFSSLAAAIDTKGLPASAKAALEDAIAEGQAAAAYEPTAGDLMSVGSTLLISIAAPLAAATNVFQADIAQNPSWINGWGMDDSEKVDVPFVVTRLSFHTSIFDEDAIPAQLNALRNTIIHGRWVLSAGETGETVLAKGCVADYLDVSARQAVYATADDAGAVTKTVGVLQETQDLDERPWQGSMVIPANYPLRMLITGAENAAAITPAQDAFAMVTICFQGVRLR